MTTDRAKRFITAAELAALLQPSASSTLASAAPSSSPPASVLIVDVRDDDFVGGHIPGAINVPSSSLHRQMGRIQQLAHGKDLVVFHCQQPPLELSPSAPMPEALSAHSTLSLCAAVGMLSQKRGPAAAAQFAEFLQQSVAAAEGAGATGPRVLVLEKGFQGWVSHLHSRVREGHEVSGLLNKYDPAVWGYDLTPKQAPR